MLYDYIIDNGNGLVRIYNVTISTSPGRKWPGSFESFELCPKVSGASVKGMVGWGWPTSWQGVARPVEARPTARR